MLNTLGNELPSLRGSFQLFLKASIFANMFRKSSFCRISVSTGRLPFLYGRLYTVTQEHDKPVNLFCLTLSATSEQGSSPVALQAWPWLQTQELAELMGSHECADRAPQCYMLSYCSALYDVKFC